MTKRPKKTEVVIKESTVADVVESETPSGKSKTVKYKAEVKETELDEIEDFESEFENENDFSDYPSQVFESENQKSFEQIPKSKIDLMFDDLRSISSADNETFYAKIIRLPDSITEFASPCRDELDLGVFQFSLRDVFVFIPTVQKRNNNSGGNFNILIYNSDHQPAEKFSHWDYSGRGKMRIMKHIGCKNVHIANPPKDEQQNAQAQPQNQYNDMNNGGGLGMVELFLKLDERNAQRQRESEERTEKLLERLMQFNKPQGESKLEAALTSKVLRDIESPPQATNAMESMITQMMMMPKILNRFSESMFPENKPPVPPSMMENLREVLSLPPVQTIVETVADIAEQAAFAKMRGVPVQQNPQAGNIAEPDNDMNNSDNELLNLIIGELETENPLDDNNETIQQLAMDFPNETENLAMLVGITDFAGLQKLLIAKLGKSNAALLQLFVDVPESQKKGELVFNERGLKMLARLEEFYNFVKAKQ